MALRSDLVSHENRVSSFRPRRAALCTWPDWCPESAPGKVPPAGLEPAPPAPEAGALSAELRGRATIRGHGAFGPVSERRETNCSAKASGTHPGTSPGPQPGLNA